VGINVKLLESFTGKAPALLLKIKGELLKAFVDFGEIRLPLSCVKRSFSGLEKRYRARFSVVGCYLVITPEFAFEQKMLCSACEEDVEKLEEWFKTCGVPLVRHLLGGV